MPAIRSAPPFDPYRPPVLREPAPRQSWRDSAGCAGLPPAVVFARRLLRAAPALRACAGCPITEECEHTVAPAENWFDGVCAGRLFRSGRAVAGLGDLAGLTNLDDLPGASA